MTDRINSQIYGSTYSCDGIDLPVNPEVSKNICPIPPNYVLGGLPNDTNAQNSFINYGNMTVVEPDMMHEIQQFKKIDSGHSNASAGLLGLPTGDEQFSLKSPADAGNHLGVDMLAQNNRSISPGISHVSHHSNSLGDVNSLTSYFQGVNLGFTHSPIVDQQTFNGYNMPNGAPNFSIPFNHELSYNCDDLDSSQDVFYGDYFCDNQLSFLPESYSNTFSTSLKEIVDVLGPEEARWFYKYEGDKKWTSFIGYDSLRIEWSYRNYMQNCNGDGSISGGVANDTSSNSSFQLEKPIVCGGLYEVDISLRKGSSIYWESEEFKMMRATWFYQGTWVPLEEKFADQIEEEHLKLYQGKTLSPVQSKDSQDAVSHSITLPEGQVDWFSPCEVFFSNDATSSRLMRSVSKKLGFQKSKLAGYRLHRGYCLDASSADKPPDITHIVFVIHGIGQKMETGRIIKNCTNLRENIKWLKEKFIPESHFCNQTVEFFPVEWRSSLPLDAGVIESITPHKVIGLRQMLNASFMDIMYYNSSQYREEIVNGLASELNRLYTMFTARNPYFEANGGKVSCIAHSLGCVITYDIVTGWSPPPEMSQTLLQALIDLSHRNRLGEDESNVYSFQSSLKHVLDHHMAQHSLPRLNFKIENFFCLGSPLAVFLGLRWQKRDNVQLPLNPHNSFSRLFNIFHPADPVAYRVEPLMSQKFYCVAPVTIHSYSTPDKTPYTELPLEALTKSSKDSTSTSQEEELTSEMPNFNEEFPTLNTVNSLTPPTSNSTIPTTPNKAAGWNLGLWNFMKTQKKTPEASTPNERQSMDESIDVEKDRIDFVLREGSMESSYLSAITSHTAYWGNMDIAYFILSTLCPQIVENQPTTVRSS